MNPVSATALYVSASRAVLQCDPRRPHTFTDMYTLLPFFRQALSCLVCGKLLQDPVSPAHPDCQHHVCSACRGQRSRTRPSCGRCRDESCLRENKPLSLLVESYRKLLLYVTHSPLLPSISSCTGGSPEVMALLEEVLMSHDEELEAEDPNPAQEAPSPAPKSLPPTEAPPALVELSVVPLSSSSDPPCSNGLQGCNGDALEVPSSPELEVCELVEEPLLTGLSISSSGCGGPELSLTGPLVSTPGIVCSLRDGEVSGRELEEGEVLLLSVEEVLQTLDPLQPSRDSPHIQQTFIRLDTAHNYTHTPALGPPPASKPPPVRLKRKRSHSESDREKIKPLPISTILQGSSPLQVPLAATHPLTAPAHTYSSFPNGVPPKPSRPTPPNKTVRKNVDPGTKKPHPKPRSTGGSRAKDAGRDQRLVPGCLLPAAPIRPPYKKPVEKRGCKCGRATQNPSVLTCRGQRCPCYSNRKACLDCICRGCQNSFMANGEKKLEAFAVPEKALEQTRLTLGINLTSITALRSPPTASLLNVATATGSPITTAFLSPSPPLEPSYEDSLELLIG